MKNELYEKLLHLQWLLHRMQQRDRAENGPMADTSRGQGRILAVLKLQDGISTKDLSYLLGVSVSSMNELLLKMERNGYITREPSEQDKRVILVKLTDKGRNAQQPESYDFNDIFSGLSDEEQQKFGEYLDRIIAVLYANIGDDDEDVYERMEDLRSRFRDMDAFFGENGCGPFRGWGFAHGFQRGFGPGRFKFGCFPGPFDFR